VRNLVGVWVRSPTLARVYLAGVLDPSLRERVMVAVSHVNACAGCTAVHERWALRAGVSDEELETIGAGDLARLDERSRAAIVYATALAEAGFGRPADRELVALVHDHLTADELSAVEAVARMRDRVVLLFYLGGDHVWFSVGRGRSSAFAGDDARLPVRPSAAKQGDALPSGSAAGRGDHRGDAPSRG